MHMDEYIDLLFTQESIFEVILPIIPQRNILEANQEIDKRTSLLDADLYIEDFDMEKIKEENENQTSEMNEKKDFFEDSDSEIDDKSNKQNEKLGVNAKRWDKVDINNEENFHQKKNPSNRKKRSRSREKVSEKQEAGGKNPVKENNKVIESKSSNKQLEEFSVEYWDNIRANLGLNLLSGGK